MPSRAARRHPYPKGIFMPALPADLLEYVSRPNPAVMATMSPEGRAVSVPIWYLAEDAEHILLSVAAENSRGSRLKHLRTDPRTSISILGLDDWTQSVSILGNAVEFFEDHNLAIIDAMALHYLGGTYAKRDPRIAVRVRIDEWTSEVNDVAFRASTTPEGKAGG
jgi:pyridoxamine 5'-phosphate oxidase-like protein